MKELSKSAQFSVQFFFVEVAVIIALTDGAGQGRAEPAFRSNHTVGLACNASEDPLDRTAQRTNDDDE